MGSPAIPPMTDCNSTLCPLKAIISSAAGLQNSLTTKCHNILWRASEAGAPNNLRKALTKHLHTDRLLKIEKHGPLLDLFY